MLFFKIALQQSISVSTQSEPRVCLALYAHQLLLHLPKLLTYSLSPLRRSLR